MDIFEQMHPWLKAHPRIMMLVPLTLGIILFLAGIFNWNWLLQPNGSWKGLGGISAYFGRTAARVASIIAGLLSFLVAAIMYASEYW